MSPTSKKIVGGALALLFIVSIVQTQAILKISNAIKGNNTVAAVSSEDQAAQVTLAASCLAVLPVDGTETSIDYPGSYVDDNNHVVDYFHTFFVNFKVKNRCSYDIYVFQDFGVIIPGVYDDTNGVFPGEFQEYNPFYEYGSPSPTVPATNLNYITSWVHGNSPYPTNPGDIDMPFSSLSGINLLQTYNGNQWAYRIPAQSIRYFTFQAAAQLDTMNLQQNFIQAYRLELKKVRWFKASDYADQVLTATELKRYNLPATLHNSVTTSYVGYVNNDPLAGTNLHMMVQKDAPASVKESLEKSLKLITSTATKKK